MNINLCCVVPLLVSANLAFAEGSNQCDFDPQGSICGEGMYATANNGIRDLLNGVEDNGTGETNCDSVIICSDPNDTTQHGYNEIIPIPPVGQEGIITGTFSVDTAAFLLGGMQSVRFMSLSYKDNVTQILKPIHFDLVNDKGSTKLSITDGWNSQPKLVPIQQNEYVRIGSSTRNGGQLQYFYVVTGATSGGVGGDIVMLSSAPVPASEISGTVSNSPNIVYTSLNQQQYLRYGFLGGTKLTTGRKDGFGGSGFNPVPVSALHDFHITLTYQPIQ